MISIVPVHDDATRLRNVTQDWYWEGKVVEAITEALQQDSWTILSAADTLSRARGADIHARRDENDFFVEVKGYPSRYYRDAARSAEQKPTNPINQAGHWYAHALLKAMRLQSAHPTASIGLGFPNFPRYRALFTETSTALNRLGIITMFVSENGSVEWYRDEQVKKPTASRP